MNKERQKIYLAALLHDIGKFYQRADEGMKDEKSNLSEYSKKLAPDICIDREKYLSHQHTVWTNQFFLDTANIFKSVKDGTESIFKTDIWSKETDKEDNLVNLSVNHHRARTELQALISMADGWSSGIDRRTASEEDDNLNYGKKRFKKVPLHSIFNNLKIEKGGNAAKTNDKNVAFGIKPLGLGSAMFPDEFDQDKITDLQNSYYKHWSMFTEEFEKLPIDNVNSFTESLLFLLKKYTWCIPSNTMDMANVSLFDHLKTTAALALCLYDYKQKNPAALEYNASNGKLKLIENQYPVLLVGVDLSGIQSFIYDISSKKAAKSLKGRSFYLQLLTESIVNKIIKHTDISVKSGNVLYASGGNFYLLLPNIKEVIDALDKIEIELEQSLWDEHKGSISINMAYVPFAYRSIKNGNSYSYLIETENQKSGVELGLLWKELSDKIAIKKNKKFATVIISKFNELFKPIKVDKDYIVCSVTGEELAENETKLIDNEYVVSNAVYEQTELGTALKDADYIIKSNENGEDSKYLSNRANVKAKIKVLNDYYYLFDKEELTKHNAEFGKISSVDGSQVIRINDTEFLTEYKLEGQAITYGYRFYGGNEQAYLKENNQIVRYRNNQKKEKTFEQLAKTESDKDSLLGVLRMDVDGLGKIFINGLSGNDKSFSAYSTLSFMLDWFFSGFLNTIRNKDKYQDFVNILYSGGDDLFIIGRWDKTIEFANEVQKEFKLFTGRTDIGLSGGITFVNSKFPISKASELADEAEKASKDYPKEEEDKTKKLKDAITFFGETISWETEFPTVLNLKNTLVSFIGRENKPLSKSILHKLILYSEIKNSHLTSKDKEQDFSFLWHTAYYIKRFQEKFKKDRADEKEIIDFLKKIQTDLFTSSKQNYRYYDLAALAARWAEMELKYK